MDLHPQDKILSVSELAGMSRNIIEREIGPVWLEGEVSNLRAQSSGHLYFTLKDDWAQVRAACFNFKNKLQKTELVDGTQVLVFGKVTIYEKNGSFQIVVQKIEQKGLGKLQIAFDKLKEKLQKQGLFDDSIKKRIPQYPNRIGIITSPSGAALRDFLNVIFRRYSTCNVAIFPSLVQGENAPANIIEGIDYFCSTQEVDVIVLTRGGGSIEDLWCFNDEIVAHKIFESSIPIISAIGHEIDWTIADFVADLRAPTPSAAAEMVIGLEDDLKKKICLIKEKISNIVRTKITFLKQNLEGLSNHYILKEPTNYITHQSQWIDELRVRLNQNFIYQFTFQKNKLTEIVERLSYVFQLRLKLIKQKFGATVAQVEAINPLKVLHRGYSVTTDEKGKVLLNVQKVKMGSKINTRLSEGTVISEVTKTSDDGHK